MRYVESCADCRKFGGNRTICLYMSRLHLAELGGFVYQHRCSERVFQHGDNTLRNFTRTA